MLATVCALLLCLALGEVRAGPTPKPFSLNRYMYKIAFPLTTLLTHEYRRNDGFPYPLDDVDKLEENSLSRFQTYLSKKNTSSHGCTLENAVRRMEWHDLTVPQREEYIRAVLCLQSKPPKADTKKYPGVLNRYDDFVLTHETQAMHLHSTVSCPNPSNNSMYG